MTIDQFNFAGKKHYRLSERDSVDADIQETADGDSEYEDYYVGGEF